MLNKPDWEGISTVTTKLSDSTGNTTDPPLVDVTCWIRTCGKVGEVGAGEGEGVACRVFKYRTNSITTTTIMATSRACVLFIISTC